MRHSDTTSIRVKDSFVATLNAIQARVVAGGSTKPTYSNILEMALSYTEENVLVTALIDLWRHPTEEDIKQSLIAAKKKKPTKRS